MTAEIVWLANCKIAPRRSGAARLKPCPTKIGPLRQSRQLLPTIRCGVISARLFCHPKTASRTRDIVFWATSRAFSEPSSIMRRTWSGWAANSSRRARIGSIHLIRLSAIAVLHSMQPIAAVRQPSADHASVSGGENSLCQSYTGQMSGLPGSVRRLRAGSVIMARDFVRMESFDSLREMKLL